MSTSGEGVTAVRRFSAFVAFVGWVYTWAVLRSLRAEHADVDKRLPAWLTLLMVGATTVMIGTALSAVLRAQVWSLLAVAAAFVFVALVVGGQRSVMQGALDFIAASEGGEPTSVGWGDAVRGALRERTPAGLVAVSAVPTLLVLGGMSGLALQRREPAG